MIAKGVYSIGIKVFNSFPRSIKFLNNDLKQFQSGLKNYLYAQFLYSVEEYFNVNREW
jgi:hypothetical protein